MPGKKIAMLVINSVSHDPRVNKEAASLVRGGFDVTVIGVMDNREAQHCETTDDRVRVIRVPWRAIRQKALVRLHLLGAIMCLSAIVAAGVAWLVLHKYINVGNWGVGQISNPWGWALFCVVAICLVLAFCYAFFKLRKRLQRMLNVYSNFIALEGKSFELAQNQLGFWARARTWMRINYNLRIIKKQMLLELEQIKPDVVHCHDLNSLPIGCAYKQNSDCLVVYDSHEIFEEVSMLDKRSRKFYRKLQRSLSKHVDAFITINDSIAEFLMKRYPKLPQAHIIMNAGKLEELPPYDGRLHLAASNALKVTSGKLLDWAGLVDQIKAEAGSTSPLPGRQIWNYFSDNLKQMLLNYDSMRSCMAGPHSTEAPTIEDNQYDKLVSLTEKMRHKLVQELDGLLSNPLLYRRQAWKNIDLPDEVEVLIARSGKDDFNDFELRRLNLLLLEAAYPGKLARSSDQLNMATNILLYQGGFSDFRGLTELVRSAGLFPNNWVLALMGWGKFEERLRHIASEVDPAGTKVHFIPPVPRKELARWTQGAAVGIIPYENVCLNHWYCTPNKLWEYPLAGVPILASPFPEIKKIIDGHNIGWLLEESIGSKGIARALRKITDEGLAEKRQNCRAFIIENNWSIYDKRINDLYKQLLAE